MFYCYSTKEKFIKGKMLNLLTGDLPLLTGDATKRGTTQLPSHKVSLQCGGVHHHDEGIGEGKKLR